MRRELWHLLLSFCFSLSGSPEGSTRSRRSSTAGSALLKIRTAPGKLCKAPRQTSDSLDDPELPSSRTPFADLKGPSLCTARPLTGISRPSRDYRDSSKMAFSSAPSSGPAGPVAQPSISPTIRQTGFHIPSEPDSNNSPVFVDPGTVARTAYSPNLVISPVTSATRQQHSGSFVDELESLLSQHETASTRTSGDSIQALSPLSPAHSAPFPTVPRHLAQFGLPPRHHSDSAVGYDSSAASSYLTSGANSLRDDHIAAQPNRSLSSGVVSRLSFSGSSRASPLSRSTFGFTPAEPEPPTPYLSQVKNEPVQLGIPPSPWGPSSFQPAGYYQRTPTAAEQWTPPVGPQPVAIPDYAASAPVASQASFGRSGSRNKLSQVDEEHGDKKAKRRQSHNAVERRRRDAINGAISDLAALLPDPYLEPRAQTHHHVSSSTLVKESMAAMQSDFVADAASPPFGTPAPNSPPQTGGMRMNKGAILSSTVTVRASARLPLIAQYVRHLQDSTSEKNARIAQLEQQLRAHGIQPDFQASQAFTGHDPNHGNSLLPTYPDDDPGAGSMDL